MKLPKVIYIMGMPGAGKGTQAEKLCAEIGYKQFSTGDAFRSISRQDTELGHKVKNIIDNGILCPPELAAEVVMAAIKDLVTEDAGLIFDGTPRTVRESEIIDEFFLEHNYGRPLAIYLEVKKEIMMERNAKRLYCMDVEGGFPVLDEEDKKRCQDMGGVVGQRPDDAPDKFMMRYNQFMEHTYPVVEKYREERILYTIDGTQSIEEVNREVMGIISRYDFEKKS
ncbi:MAG: nucleoside monophosphate kinase [Candidatus Andersenbacteria bacterium]|nr:nucleoside monophosphate kinase [Candidatus Andersenbacteria bacterium]